MFAAETYVARRAALAHRMRGGLILLPGNVDAPLNYRGNVYPFRQDGTFRYYAGLDAPALALTLDADSGEATLFADKPTLDDVVWEGPRPPLAEQGWRAGIQTIRPLADLADAVREAKAAGRPLHFLPPYRGEQQLALGALLRADPQTIHEGASAELIEAVVAQRLVKTDEEVAEMEAALDVTAAMHRLAMRSAQPGRTEREIAGAIEGLAIGRGRGVAYGTILTQRGETLHNHATDRVIEAGSLLLVDAGAVSAGGYAGDITRTAPVGGHFSEMQRALYDLVLDVQLGAIAACRPGVAYRDVHTGAARRMVDGLITLGLMRGDPDEAVAAGAHALFFPHGLGHAIGLDVHDLEALGEDHVGYDAEFVRSTQFGTAFLRFARRLTPGMVLTVEPGIYFIDALLDGWKADRTHAAFLDFHAIEAYRGLGGIRIEDNVVITETGCRVLGPGIPKTAAEVEAEVQAGVDPIAPGPLLAVAI